MGPPRFRGGALAGARMLRGCCADSAFSREALGETRFFAHGFLGRCHGARKDSAGRAWGGARISEGRGFCRADSAARILPRGFRGGCRRGVRGVLRGFLRGFRADSCADFARTPRFPGCPRRNPRFVAHGFCAENPRAPPGPPTVSGTNPGPQERNPCPQDSWLPGLRAPGPPRILAPRAPQDPWPRLAPFSSRRKQGQSRRCQEPAHLSYALAWLARAGAAQGVPHMQRASEASEHLSS